MLTMTRLGITKLVWLMVHTVIIVQGRQGRPRMGRGMPGIPGMGGGISGMEGGIPGMGGGIPGMGGGIPGMGGGIPGMGGGIPGMGGGIPGMGGGIPGMGGGISGMGGGIPGQETTHTQIKQAKDKQNSAARLVLSTTSIDGNIEENVQFAIGQAASYQWGWLTEIPADDVGHGCSPLTEKHKEGKLIALIKRGGCDFSDKAINGGTKMSIIYDTEETGERPTSISGFGE